MAAVGRLAGDFFNYSLPGLREICLHGCRLAVDDIKALLESLVMNTSVTTLDLSLNLLGDDALLPLLHLVRTRPKSQLRYIGFSWNQVRPCCPYPMPLPDALIRCPYPMPLPDTPTRYPNPIP